METDATDGGNAATNENGQRKYKVVRTKKDYPSTVRGVRRLCFRRFQTPLSCLVLRPIINFFLSLVRRAVSMCGWSARDAKQTANAEHNNNNNKILITRYAINMATE